MSSHIFQHTAHTQFKLDRTAIATHRPNSQRPHDRTNWNWPTKRGRHSLLNLPCWIKFSSSIKSIEIQIKKPEQIRFKANARYEKRSVLVLYFFRDFLRKCANKLRRALFAQPSRFAQSADMSAACVVLRLPRGCSENSNFWKPLFRENKRKFKTFVTFFYCEHLLHIDLLFLVS